MKNDYDSPWKEIVELYFPDLVTLPEELEEAFRLGRHFSPASNA